MTLNDEFAGISSRSAILRKLDVEQLRSLVESRDSTACLTVEAAAFVGLAPLGSVATAGRSGVALWNVRGVNATMSGAKFAMISEIYGAVVEDETPSAGRFATKAAVVGGIELGLPATLNLLKPFFVPSARAAGLSASERVIIAGKNGYATLNRGLLDSTSAMPLQEGPRITPSGIKVLTDAGIYSEARASYPLLDVVAPRGTFDLSQSVGAARVSSWGSRLEGTRLKQVGNYWIKEVDPKASALRQWWGRGSLNAQAKAIDRLGDMAPSHLYKNGKLIIRDVGEFAGTRGDVFKTWVRGSWRLRTPMNDIRARNMGANGLIFDPALHPIHQAIYWGGTGVGIYVVYEGGELICLHLGGPDQ